MVIVSKTERGVVVDIAEQIKQKLTENFQPSHLALENESHMHAGPATDTHFKLTLVSEKLSGMNAVKRHQAVYKVLRDELAGSLHALAMHLYSGEEWEAINQVPDSPLCAGKNK